MKSGCNEQDLDCNSPVFVLFTSSYLPGINWLDGFNKRVSAIVCVLHRVFFAPKEASGTLLLIPDSWDFAFSIERHFLVSFRAHSVTHCASVCSLCCFISQLVVRVHELEHLLKWPFQNLNSASIIFMYSLHLVFLACYTIPLSSGISESFPNLTPLMQKNSVGVLFEELYWQVQCI